MKIERVYANNYKGFKKVDLNLRKINIFLGKNGAGKSSILRLVALIIDGIASGSKFGMFAPQGLNLAGKFSELVHKGLETSIVTLGAEFYITESKYLYEIQLMYSTELRIVVVNSFIFSSNGVKIVDVKYGGIENKKIKYTFFGNENEIFFDGFFIRYENVDYISEENKRILDFFIQEVALINGNFNYLGPFRDLPLRVYPHRLETYRNVGVGGQHAPYIFYDAYRAFDSLIISEIEKWMNMNLGGKQISCRDSENGFSITVKSNSGNINICDEGVGYSQLFPVILCHFKSALEGGAGINIIEQPEIHLHPSVAGVVADLLLYKGDENNTISIIETHSKEVILRFRRRVAESQDKSLSESINIIYVGTDELSGDDSLRTRYIRINNDGTTDWWPTGIFEESFEEVMAIHDANHGRQ
ncbi:AAA family ATPase [Rheinheimera sp.]|uniref:AAA family ATPase n=1 Tax=Rheinheimera sp. TaxID=1869214 RepID=UPI00307DCBA5